MNIYLAGNYAPVDRERTDFNLPVTGEIPDCLNGRYLRNGPNPARPPDPESYHYFTGDGMVHGIQLRDGKAEWYRNRWIRAGAVPAALGETDPGGPGTAGADFAANTNVMQLAGRTFALVEAGAKPVELNERLETVGRCDFGGKLTYGFTAHPKIDPVTGDIHAADYFWAHPNVIEYVVLDACGSVTHSEDIVVGGSPMVHDVSITENYVLFYDLPVTFDQHWAVNGSPLPYTWNDNYGARVGVLPKDRSAMSPPVWFEVDPCFVFHALNAYESTNSAGENLVVVDLVRHPRVFDMNPLAPDEGDPVLWRWELNLSTGRVGETQLGDSVIEFPRIDERLMGRAYRYGYAIAFEGNPGDNTRLRNGVHIECHDMVNRTVESHDLGPRMAAGEAVFVPASDGSTEDDGYLLCLVYDYDTDRSELRIISTKDISGEPVARVHLPTRVPFGFHGNWVPS